MSIESRRTIGFAAAFLILTVSLSAAAEAPFNLIGKAPETARRPSPLTDLGLNFTSIAKQPDLYLLIAGLSVIPSLERRESVDLNQDLRENPNAHRLLKYGNILGNPIIPLAASVTSYGVGRWVHSRKLAAFGSDLISAQMLNGVVTLSMKVSLGRRRPDHAPYAFPSGHSSTAFTTAGVIMRHFGYGWGMLAEGVGAYVGISRLEANKHYLSDVVAGAILGNYLAWKVCRRRSGAESFNLTPTIDSKQLGAQMSLRF